MTSSFLTGKFPMLEKNLLKVFKSNQHIQLQAVNTKTGHIFCCASTVEKCLREKLGRKTYDRDAAIAVADLFVERARAGGFQQLTYERHRQRYEGNVKRALDRLREGGIEFVQHAARGPPKQPWGETPPEPPVPF